MANIEDMLGDIDRLPALPGTVARLIPMLQSGMADLGEITDILRNDDALSIVVLKYANSAMYGRPGKEFDLRESIVRLGGKVLTRILLEQEMTSMYAGGGTSYGLRRGALWRGALGGAVAAEHIAQKQKYDDSELCFLCGLLRDIGKLVMDQQFGGAYSDNVMRCADASKTFVECEREAFGFDHAQVGGALATQWGLPERIADAIRFHHEPPADPPEQDSLFDIVHAADVICLWAGLAIGDDGLQYRLAPHVRKALDLDRRTAEYEITLTWGKVRELEELMGIAENGELCA